MRQPNEHILSKTAYKACADAQRNRSERAKDTEESLKFAVKRMSTCRNNPSVGRIALHGRRTIAAMRRGDDAADRCVDSIDKEEIWEQLTRDISLEKLKRRVERCAAYLDRPISYFQRIIFSDEKFFYTGDNGSNWRFPLAKGALAARVHVWGCIGLNFRLLVVLSEEQRTGATYMQQCLHKLIAALQENGIENAVFQFDGNRTHSWEPALQYLANKGVETLAEWPARSPDLSPIENMWALVAKEVSERGPVDEKELAKFVVEEWDKIPQETVNKLVRSFRGRCRMCVDGQGATINTRGASKRARVA